MTTDTSESARAYARIRYRLILAELASSLLLLGWLHGSGCSRALAHWWSSRAGSEWLVILGYLLVFAVIYYLVMLPLHLYGSFVLEHRFNLSRMTVKAWGIREVKQLALSALLGVGLIEGLYALFRHAPTRWPMWAAVGWVVVSVGLARIFPTILLPLFYTTTPLGDEALVRRLLKLCQQVGLPALGVFRVNLGVETRKANAALAGIGKTRRVLLSDTLLTQFTPEEIEGVLAHELAHYRYRHIAKMLVLSVLGSYVAFLVIDVVALRWMGPLGVGDLSDAGWVSPLGVRELSDIAGFPLLALWLSLLNLISLPIQNGLSRFFEWQADQFAIATTKLPQAFAQALRRLAQLNLADPSPPRWVVWLFYDHPPITERIRAAEAASIHSSPGEP